MKHVYPPRHPASLDAADGAAPGQPHEPALPHERDESSGSQDSATPQQKDVGRRAYANATDGTSDTDRAPVVDQVYNEKVAPDRGQARPRR